MKWLKGWGEVKLYQNKKTLLHPAAVPPPLNSPGLSIFPNAREHLEWWKASLVDNTMDTEMAYDSWILYISKWWGGIEHWNLLYMDKKVSTKWVWCSECLRFFDPDVFPSSQVLEDNWNCEDLISKVVLIIPIHLQISKTMIYNLQHSTGKKNSLRNLTLVDSNSFQYLINES